MHCTMCFYLESISQEWNHHPIRTDNHSPHQLFSAEALLLQHSKIAALDFFDSVDDHYGEDMDAPTAESDAVALTIPEIRCPTSETHNKNMHCTMCFYLESINQSLSTFMQEWNHHPIRTAHNHSPHQLFSAGALLLQHSQIYSCS